MYYTVRGTVPCALMLPFNIDSCFYMQGNDRRMNAVLPQQTLWDKPVLKVFFYSPDKTEWTYEGAPLQPFKILRIANEGWDMTKMKHGKYVPRFEWADFKHDAQIRVQFQSKFCISIGMGEWPLNQR